MSSLGIACSGWEEALDAVRTARLDIGIVGMNDFEIRGHGRLGSQEHS